MLIADILFRSVPDDWGWRYQVFDEEKDSRASVLLSLDSFNQNNFLRSFDFLDFIPVCNIAVCKKEAFDRSPHCEARKSSVLNNF